MKKLLYLLSLVITLFFVRCEPEENMLSLSSLSDANAQPVEMQANANGFIGRIAISADGNNGDRDDIGATPMGLAIIAHLGLQNKLVHYDYNSCIWGNGPNGQKNDMTESALGAASRFGFNKSVFISAIDQLDKAKKSLAAAINNSSSSNPLYIVVAGPMAVVCEGIKGSDPAKRKYVTVISHSSDNNNYARGGSCTADGVKKTGVRFVQISSQNTNFATKNWSEYEWLKNHSNGNLRWVYERMRTAFDYKADVSDAGMVWYLVKNDQKGTPGKLKSFFANGSPDPKPKPNPKPNPTPKPDPKPNPNPVPNGDNCQASGNTLSEARRNFEKHCGVKYDKSKGHDCDPDGKGGYICSTGKVGGGGGSSSDKGKGSSSDDDNCQAYGKTNLEAQRNLKKHCGVTYDKSKGHDCDPDGKGGWICSTNN